MQKQDVNMLERKFSLQVYYSKISEYCQLTKYTTFPYFSFKLPINWHVF